jgi:hypothetical protein
MDARQPPYLEPRGYAYFSFLTVEGPRRSEVSHCLSRGKYNLQKRPYNNVVLRKAQPTDKAISFTKNTLKQKDKKQSCP